MTKTEEQAYMQQLVDSQKALYLLVAGALPLSRSDVEDVVQRTNYALIKGIDKFDPSQPFHPWLVTFARNQIKAYRKEQKNSRLVFDDDVLDRCVDSSAGRSAEAEERYRRLTVCHEKLTDQQKKLLADHYDLDKPIVQMAREARTNPVTVRSLLFRIREKLRECIERMCRLEEKAGEPLSGEERAVDDLLNGECRAEDASRVNALFRDSPGALELWIGQREIDTLLRLQARARPAAPAFAWRPRRRVLAWAAAAALAALFTGGALLWKPQRKAAAALPQPVEMAEKTAEPPAPEKPLPPPAETAQGIEGRKPALHEPAPAAIAAKERAKEQNEGERMNATEWKAAGKAVVVALAAATAPMAPAAAETGDTSAGISATVNEKASVFWHSLPGRTAQLQICWPLGAKNATVSVSGLRESSNVLQSAEGPLLASLTVTNPVPEVTLRAPAPDIAKMGADVYRLRLVFDNGTEKTALLGNVGGIDGAGLRFVGSKSSRDWIRLQSSAVLAVHQGDTALQIGTRSVALDGAAGWYGWSGIKKGDYALTLGERTAALHKSEDGFVIMLK